MFSMLEIGDARWPAGVIGLGPNRRDVHMDARMLAPYVAASSCKAYLAFTEREDGYIVQPVLTTPYGQLRHAYNFGGPMGTSDLLSSKEHTDSLNEWALKHSARSQYCTLIPNLAREQLRLLSSSGIIPENKKQSVVINLGDMKVRGTTRRMANKAQGKGVTVKAYPLDHLKHFIDIYNVTMERVQAKEHWLFSDKWFELFARFVKPCLLLAEYEDKFEAACLIAYSQQYPVAYYHFAGSLNTHPGLGINHQMVLAACEFVKLTGVKQLYLGGGITDKTDDGLLVFKSGFSPLRQSVYSYEMPCQRNTESQVDQMNLPLAKANIG